MHRIAWVGDLAVVDAVHRESVAGGLAVHSLLEPARSDLIAMDQLRLLLCQLGHHGVHRMADDEVLYAIADRIEGGLLHVIPVSALPELLFGPAEARASGSPSASAPGTPPEAVPVAATLPLRHPDGPCGISASRARR
jgi:hypothetical protein